MTVKEIVVEYLEKNGFDGLCNNYGYCVGDNYGCKKDEICLCDNFSQVCEPAYIVKADACRLCKEYKFCMSQEKDTNECPCGCFEEWQ